MPDVVDASGVSMSNNLSDITGFARTLAAKRAAETGNPTTVIMPRGVQITELPPPRPTDIQQTAQGSPPTTPPPSERRNQSVNEGRAQGERGQSNENDEQDGSKSGGSPVDQTFPVFGALRDLGKAVIPTMEALMFDVPQAVLGKFTSLLPPIFKSLLPLGAVGAVAAIASKGPVSLTGLTQLVGGAALGAVAGQAIRSLSGGVTGVQGLTGALGAQAITRVTGSSAVPVNIATTYGSAVLGGRAASGTYRGIPQTQGTSPQTTAVLANVVGTITSVALNRNSRGIPVSAPILGLAANVALRTAGVPTAIPTSVLGLAASSGVSPLASLLGSTVSGRVPILPGNLSLPNIGALSGISQNLSPGLAERLIPSNQLAGLLPGNLRSQLPAVPPRVTSPGSVNDIQARNQAASQRVPDADLRPNGTPPDAKPAVLKGTDGGRIPYEQKISPGGITLGQVSTRAQSAHNIIPQNGLSVDKIIEGLSWVATNILDPIFAAYPGWTITSGFRGPGGSNTGGDHGRGAAVDFKWYSKSRAEHLQICQWIRQQGIPVDFLIFERPGNTVWIHVAGGPTGRGVKGTQTYFGGSTYRPGLIL